MKKMLVLASALMAFGMGASYAEDGVTANEVRIGSSADMSAAFKGIGEDQKLGFDIYFKWVNENGGVKGRKISYTMLDDTYKPDIALQNAKSLLEGPQEKRVLAWINQAGTGSSMKLFPYMTEKKVPFLFPFSGAEALRGKGRYVFNTRASYDDEMAKIAEYVDGSGIKTISVVYQDDPFGKAGLASLEKAAEKYKLKITTKVPVKTDGSNVADAYRPVVDAKNQAIVMSGTGGLVSGFVKEYAKANDKKTKIFAMSVVDYRSLFAKAGSASYGLMITQVVPNPKSEEDDVAKLARTLFKKYNVSEDKLSPIVLESIVSAKILVTALNAAKEPLTRESLIDALEAMGNDADKGTFYGFSKTNHDGNRLVDIMMIDKSGNLIE